MKKKFIELLSPKREKEIFEKYLKPDGLTEKRWLHNPVLDYEIWQNWDGLNVCSGKWLIVFKRNWGYICRRKIED